MLRFTYKGFTLAHMDLEFTTKEQVEACRQIVSGVFGVPVICVRKIIGD